MACMISIYGHFASQSTSRDSARCSCCYSLPSLTSSLVVRILYKRGSHQGLICPADNSRNEKFEIVTSQWLINDNVADRVVLGTPIYKHDINDNDECLGRYRILSSSIEDYHPCVFRETIYKTMYVQKLGLNICRFHQPSSPGSTIHILHPHIVIHL